MWRPHPPVSNLETGILTPKRVHKFLTILSTHLNRFGEILCRVPNNLVKNCRLCENWWSINHT